MNITTELEQVLEAACIRRDQWEGIANGETVDALTGELAEADAGEARSLALLLSHAIDIINAADLVTGETATTAMCIWEAVLEAQFQWKKHATENEPVHEWIADGEGVYQARSNCVTIAPFFDEVWERIDARGYGGAFAFDWEIVPWVLGYVVEHYGSPAELAGRDKREAQVVANAFLDSNEDERNSHV